MSVDLTKNRNEIISGWKEVLDGKSPTDWALFGYEGQTNCLKLISKGDGGLNELADELNSGKIMYAFVSVQDTKTSLTKCLLINWQGEGAPTVRKGTCANHIRDISKLLTGAHLTINARTEDDIETERIMEKISAVGSAYSFKEPRTKTDEQRGPVGTNYARVIPSKEINSMDRDNFWKKEEEEERSRIESERERRERELLKQEQERRLREEHEHKERERRLIEANIENQAPIGNGKVHEETVQSVTRILNSPPAAERKSTQAEEMRQQRNKEAKELIGSRVDTAKAIFAQNSASSQMSASTKAAPIKPIRNSIAQRINSLSNQETAQQSTENVNQLQNDNQGDNDVATNKVNNVGAVKQVINDSNLKQTEEQNTVVNNVESKSNEQTAIASEEEDSDPFSTIKRSPYSKTSHSQLTSPETEPHSNIQQIINGNDIAKNGDKATNSVNLDQNNEEVITAEDIIYQDLMHEDGLRACALYDYQADDETEITFDPGDIITHIDQIDEGWWQGLGPDGTYGLFPANYVELIK